MDEVQEALERIARLEPVPARAFLPITIIRPPGSVRAKAVTIPVTNNNEHIPHFAHQQYLQDLMAQGENSAEVRNYIREKIRAGKFLIRACTSGRPPS